MFLRQIAFRPFLNRRLSEIPNVEVVFLAIYNSLSALESALRTATQKLLKTEVVPLVEKEIAQQEQELVYESYSPIVYKRRNSLG